MPPRSQLKSQDDLLEEIEARITARIDALRPALVEWAQYSDKLGRKQAQEEMHQQMALVRAQLREDLQAAEERLAARFQGLHDSVQAVLDRVLPLLPVPPES